MYDMYVDQQDFSHFTVNFFKKPEFLINNNALMMRMQCVFSFTYLFEIDENTLSCM